MTSAPDPLRLADHVKKRRRKLGLSLRDVQAMGGPSTVTASKIEHAKLPTLTPGTLGKIDTALGWAPGSAAEVFHGGDPQPLGEPGTNGRQVVGTTHDFAADLDSVTLTIEAVLALDELSGRLLRLGKDDPDNVELNSVAAAFDRTVERMMRQWIITQLESNTRASNLRVLEQLHLKQYLDRGAGAVDAQDDEDLTYMQWLAGRIETDSLDPKIARRFAGRLKRANKKKGPA